MNECLSVGIELSMHSDLMADTLLCCVWSSGHDAYPPTVNHFDESVYVLAGKSNMNFPFTSNM